MTEKEKSMSLFLRFTEMVQVEEDKERDLMVGIHPVSNPTDRPFMYAALKAQYFS